MYCILDLAGCQASRLQLCQQLLQSYWIISGVPMFKVNAYLLANVVITALCKYTGHVKPALVVLTCVQDSFPMMLTEMRA